MKANTHIILFFVLSFCFLVAYSQGDKKTNTKMPSVETNTKTPIRIGILLPLYLDSIYHEKKDIFATPDIIPLDYFSAYEFLTGIEYYFSRHDILPKNCEFFILDSRRLMNVNDSLSKEFLYAMHLNYIITTETGSAMQQLVSFAKAYQTVVISVLDPSTQHTKENPYYIILNPTLLSHLEKLYAYTAIHHPAFDRISVFLNTEEDTTLLHRWTKAYIDLKNSANNKKYTYYTSPPKSIGFIKKNLSKYFLPYPKKNAVFIGTYSSEMANDFIDGFAPIDTTQYQIAFFGMPMWSENEEIQTKYFGHKSFVYSKSFCWDPHKEPLEKVYRNITDYFYIPSGEMGLLAYAVMSDFMKIIEPTYWSFWQNMTEANSMEFFKIQPVNSELRNTKHIPFVENSTIDYYENTKLFIIHKSPTGFTQTLSPDKDAKELPPH